jgi:hypothetical protein
MKKLHALIAAASVAFALGSAHAADDAKTAKPKTAQQEKMTTCNKDAEGKKGDERKAFMKECLSAKAAAAPTQQEKMKTCNADAKDMKGDERKKFMSSCLKKA